MSIRNPRSLRNLGFFLIQRSFTSSITSQTTKTNIPKVVKMILAEKNDSMNKQIGAFLTETFVKQEPVILAAKLDSTRDVEEYILGDVRDGRSLLIVNPETNEILAAAVSTDTKPYTPQICRDYADVKVSSNKTKRLLYFWASILENARLFEKFPFDKIWNISYLATSDKMQGHGLSRFLTHQTRLLAIEAGYSAIHMDCTSNFSAKIAKRVGFKALQERNVQSYLDNNGNPWIANVPTPPHGTIVITGEKLPNKI